MGGFRRFLTFVRDPGRGRRLRSRWLVQGTSLRYTAWKHAMPGGAGMAARSGNFGGCSSPDRRSAPAPGCQKRSCRVLEMGTGVAAAPMRRPRTDPDHERRKAGSEPEFQRVSDPFRPRRWARGDNGPLALFRADLLIRGGGTPPGDHVVAGMATVRHRVGSRRRWPYPVGSIRGRVPFVAAGSESAAWGGAAPRSGSRP